MAHQLSCSDDKRVMLSEVRFQQQQKLNEDAKIAEQIRKEKERQKMKEKLERYERLGWKIFGPTCEPRQEYRTENAEAIMDQKLAEARDKMQIFYNKKAANVKPVESETPEAYKKKEELEIKRKKEMLRILNEKRQHLLKKIQLPSLLQKS